MKKLVFTLFLFLVLSFGAYSATAQTVSPAQDQCLVALEKEADLRKRTEIERDSYKKQSELKDAVISGLEKQVELLEGIVKNLDKQSANSDKIDVKTQMIIDNLRTQVAEMRSELVQVRKERDDARKWGNVKMIGGAVTGFVIGKTQ